MHVISKCGEYRLQLSVSAFTCTTMLEMEFPKFVPVIPKLPSELYATVVMVGAG
jgi:hypothetical protein